MSVQDKDIFKKWDAANQKYDRLAKFHNALINAGRRPDEALLEQVMKERDEAHRELDRIVSNL